MLKIFSKGKDRTQEERNFVSSIIRIFPVILFFFDFPISMENMAVVFMTNQGDTKGCEEFMIVVVNLTKELHVHLLRRQKREIHNSIAFPLTATKTGASLF